MLYPLHKNDTGSFQELAHTYDGIEFGQLSLLTIAPGCSRGGHYHTRKKEWFCCIHGKCSVVCTNISTVRQRSIHLDGQNREFVSVEPYESHIVINYDADECTLLVICSESYNRNDTDTIEWSANIID